MEIRPVIPPRVVNIFAEDLIRRVTAHGIKRSPYLIGRLTPRQEDFTLTKTPAGDQVKLSPESARRFEDEIFQARLRAGDLISLQNELLPVAEAPDQGEGKAIALFRLALVYDASGIYSANPPGALECLSDALGIFKKEGAEPWEARTLLQMGVVHLKLGSNAESSTCLGSSLSMFTALGDKKGIADYHLYFGYLRFNQVRVDQNLQADIEEVQKHYNQAGQIYQELQDRASSAKVLLRIAEIHLFAKQYAEAIRLCDLGLKVADFSGDQRQIAKGLLLKGIAMFQSDKSKPEEGYNLIADAYDIFNELRDMPGQANCLYQLAMILLHMEEFEQAKINFDQAYALRKQTGDKRGQGLSCLGMGLYYEKVGDKQTALSWYREAEQLFEPLNSPILSTVRSSIAGLQA